MKALRLNGNLELSYDAPLPRRPGEALVQVICAGICNTDLEIAKGYGAFQGTLGHEFVGRVAESPDGSMDGRRVVGEINIGCGRCKRCANGDSRHCAGRTVLGIKGRDGAFAEYLSLPVSNLIEVPESISDEAAVFAEPLAAAFNILEQVDIDRSHEIALIGDGKLAQLIALVMCQTNCALTIIGKHSKKLQLAQGFCPQASLMDALAVGPDFAARFDIVIDATGSPLGLATALEIVKPRGTVVLKSTHHGSTMVDTSRVVVNEVKMIGSRCGRLQPALDLLSSRGAELETLISRKMPLVQGLLAFEAAASSESMKVILQVA